MKAFLLGSAAILAVSSAQAADMRPVVAAAAPACSWCGAYIGATVGYAWSEIAPDLMDIKAKPNSFAPGGVAGYRWGRTLTFAVEINGTYLGHSDTVLDGVSGKVQYLGDITAQLGLALNNGVLVYVGAGPALANSQVNIDGLTSTANSFGWVVRTGADIKIFNSNWSAGVVYSHYELGDQTFFGIVNASSKVDMVQGRLVYRFTNH